MTVVAVNLKKLKIYNKTIMKIYNKETQLRKKVTMTFKNRHLSYIEREMIINLYTSTVLSYYQQLELKGCKINKI